MSEFEKRFPKPELTDNSETCNSEIWYVYEDIKEGWREALKCFEKIENAYICKAAMKQEIEELEKEKEL